MCAWESGKASPPCSPQMPAHDKLSLTSHKTRKIRTTCRFCFVKLNELGVGHHSGLRDEDAKRLSLGQTDRGQQDGGACEWMLFLAAPRLPARCRFL